jgi:hypothetical protein
MFLKLKIQIYSHLNPDRTVHKNSISSNAQDTIALVPMYFNWNTFVTVDKQRSDFPYAITAKVKDVFARQQL